MIEVNNLVKYYRDFKAVDGISFTIERGEIVGLLGPNGAGKSTTIRTLCGYLAPTSGTLKVGDYSVGQDELMVKKSIGYLPESAPLYADMMVYDYLAFIAKVREVPRNQVAERIADMVNTCGLKDVIHKNINELSKGYKQRVGLAHALIGDPQVLILDEPTSGLDPNQIIEIRKLIKKISETKTIILSSHILSEVEATCDRIIIINKGKKVADSKTIDLKKQLGKEKSIIIEFDTIVREELDNLAQDLKDSYSSSDNLSITEESKPSGDGLTFIISYQGEKDLRSEVFGLISKTNLKPVNFFQKEESLEDIFRKLTKSETEKNETEKSGTGKNSSDEKNNSEAVKEVNHEVHQEIQQEVREKETPEETKDPESGAETEGEKGEK